MKTLAIIPARGGSKRIPRKNIKDFLGKPMIAYAIKACLQSKLFDEVMVSTDDAEIAAIAKKYGATVPFIRSEKTSCDYATTYDVLEEVIHEYKKLGVEINTICCVYPCVPLLNAMTLKEAYIKFIETKADSLVPIVKFSYPIQRAFKVSDNYIQYNEPKYINSRSQDLEPMYHDVGMFYFAKVKQLLEQKTLVGKKTTFYEMQESEVQDIDNEEDWKIAEIKYKIMYGDT